MISKSRIDFYIWEGIANLCVDLNKTFCVSTLRSLPNSVIDDVSSEIHVGNILGIGRKLR